MEWIIAAVTFAFLYWLATLLHSVWDAGYWFFTVPMPFAIVGTVYWFSPEEDRVIFRDDMRGWLNWLMRRR